MEAVVIQRDRDPPKNGSFAVSSSSASAVFRRIEFRPAMIRFNGFFSNGRSDFKIETLNPSSDNKRAFSDLSEHGLDQEHCTSKITGQVASGSACLHVKHNSVSVHSKRISSNGNMLLASDQLRSSVFSEASQNSKRKRGASKEEQISLQKEEHVTILTPGLPETVVAKWDEETSASKKMGKSEGTRIGYVADEWDEEYDRGKKKKIRMKEEWYGGPNPFQLIASRKLTDTKKKWRQRMNTAKTGFTDMNKGTSRNVNKPGKESL